MGTAAVSSGAMEAGGGGPGAAAPSRSAAPGHEPGAAASSPRPRKKRRKCSIPSINLTSCKYESGKSKDVALWIEPTHSKPCRWLFSH